MQITVVFHFIADVCVVNNYCVVVIIVWLHGCLGCTTTKPQFCTYVVTHIFITLTVMYTRLKKGLKCMHSVCVSSHLLVSVLFIVVPTNTENSIFFILVLLGILNIHWSVFQGLYGDCFLIDLLGSLDLQGWVPHN